MTGVLVGTSVNTQSVLSNSHAAILHGKSQKPSAIHSGGHCGWHQDSSGAPGVNQLQVGAAVAGCFVGDSVGDDAAVGCFVAPVGAPVGASVGAPVGATEGGV